jgi:hypothetical protein
MRLKRKKVQKTVKKSRENSWFDITLGLSYVLVVGERCQVDQNCYLGEQGPERQAFCVRGYCTCQLQYSPRDNGTRYIIRNCIILK